MIHKKVKYIIDSKDVSVIDLANYLGITRQSLYNMLSGRSSITVDTLQKIADYLKVSVTSFFVDKGQDLLSNPPNQIITDTLFQANENISKEYEKERNAFNEKISLLKQSSIGLDKIEDLGIEIKQNSKEGRGLVNLEFDIIEKKFKSTYRDLKKPFDYKTEINHVTDQISQVVKQIDGDSKALKIKKKK
jgi:transcriptional regulator with XRE-family HTH domain